jgi:hypothetical protein
MFMQLAMIIIKNSIKTANASVWRQIDSQKPTGSHLAYKHCETSCKRALKMPQSLQKVEPDSTPRNGCYNKNIARFVDC